jgi:hypothetical protein
MSDALLPTHPEASMRGLVSLGILLVVLWAVAWLVFKTAGFFIHLLLIVGAIMLIVGLVKRAGRAVSRDL